MFKGVGLYPRILIPFVLITLLGGLAQMFIAGTQLERATYEFNQHHLETDALMVAASLGEPLEKYMEEANDSDLRRALVVLNQEKRYEYLIADRDFHVVGYTPGVGITVPTDHEVSLSLPELTRASQGEIGSDVRPDLQSVDRLFVAVPVLYDRAILGYLLLSQPMEPATIEAHNQWLQLIGTAAPVLFLIIFASLWIAGTIARPIRQMRNMALEMAHGALDKRIRVHSRDDIGQLADAFNFMAGQLEQLIRAQRSFVSNAAHELRTPLMTVKLRLEALTDPALAPGQRDLYLDELQREINHMAELVSSLLVLARIDEGRHDSDGEAVDVAAILSDSARQWRIAAQREGLRFEAAIPADLPPLAIPSAEIRLLVDNLLSNAIKYTSAGGIRLRAWQKPHDLIIEVSDTGVGFLPEEGARLFDRFYRSSTSRHEISGHGLGLSIVQAVLEHYGATVEARSLGVNQGATFTLHLPTAA
ncbi:MAG: HAMP domain-containing protein [Anaerolineae bacterium]|nr:HAMP domain-containing protein [Anaerolineae bacterium]